MNTAKFWARRSHGPIKAIHPMTGEMIEVDPQRLDARISQDLDAELRRLPGVLSWWLALRDTAEEARDHARHEEHNVAEDLYDALRQKSPKATETFLKMQVKKHPSMREAFRVRMDAEHMYRRLKSAVQAIEEKRWSLQGLVKTSMSERVTRDNA